MSDVDYAEVIERIRQLSSKEALLEMIEAAGAPRTNPNYPGVEVTRSNPTEFIEGYTTALTKVSSIVLAAESRASAPDEGGAEKP